ncbi:hypothetical protein MWG07_09210 [Fusobacterium necrophorum]|uniref:Uncharacterized protein n=2 Tax=Fusobacterium necrophorum TaxID=859 RepID=A0A162J1R9_9FUSO|nr:hypothetical protein [Fusobacterium necrophorum]KDE68982.1 hypothetical protein FUSO7_12355 [Fusobacterium necrophorum BFTR-2]KYL04886.1 hypothetical protein A2J07_09810 [Fusobacterium necrophorum subsp. funduliforme]KYM67129.1 hypothetical protein A2U13_08880 [Fusobacterium necrophorum subsp. funduliforme]MDK4481198.1 hypothetical protein [Fusobacterium necrophorum]MDK4512424.1 hypothetical protein [Fusobacterium necrophorum]
MKQVVRFKSYPKFFEKEKSGLKCNTVRVFDTYDDRIKFLYNVFSEKEKDVFIEIENTETKEKFQRVISDVSTFKIGNEEVYIISWRHEDDETKA